MLEELRLKNSFDITQLIPKGDKKQKQKAQRNLNVIGE